MDKLKWLREELPVKEKELKDLNDKLDNEKRARTDEEKAQFDELRNTIKSLREEIKEKEEAEKVETKAKEDTKGDEQRTAAMAASTGEPKKDGSNDELLRMSAKIDFSKVAKAVREKRAIDGLEAELTQEAQKEAREGGGEYTVTGDISIPASMLRAEWEQRATVDQTNSAIQPTFVGRYVEGIRQNAVFSQVVPASNIITGLTGDFKIPAVGANTVAWATAENSAAADGGAQFTKDTLAPVRATGYYDISNRLLMQNGSVVMDMVASDVARATAELIDDALFSTTDITNGIPSIAGTSGTLTFTETATYAATSSTANGSVYDDYLEALQTLANGNTAKGALKFVGHSKLMSDLVKSPQVLSVTPGVTSPFVGGAPMILNLNGIQFYLTTSNTSNGTTSADFIGGDFNFQYIGFFGGLDISMDPYSAKLNDEMRLVLHRHLDASTIRGAAFVKATSLLS